MIVFGFWLMVHGSDFKFQVSGFVEISKKTPLIDARFARAFIFQIKELIFLLALGKILI